MRYLALACDYDGTLATHGRVGPETVAALQRCRESGRKLLLVTGRELPELRAIFPHLELFDRIVAENGALLFDPARDLETPLASPPPIGFLQALKARDVAPISLGRAIVATWQPHETAVLAAIQELGLELQVIFNKGAVMVLPSGVNKATGLKAALKEMRLSPHNVVGVGDAENDHSFLSICEASVAVANALPTLQERVDWVTPADHGAGVEQLVAGLLSDDLASLCPRLLRHHVALARRDDKRMVSAAPYGKNLLVSGLSPADEVTFVLSFLGRLSAARYQFCAIDPEGTLPPIDGAVAIGTQERAPDIEQAFQVLEDPSRNALVNMAAVPLRDRPAAFLALLERLQSLRRARGRPHWIAIDRAHLVLPSMLEPAAAGWPQRLEGLLIVTQQAASLAPAILKTIDMAILGGENCSATWAACAKSRGDDSRHDASETSRNGDVVLWQAGRSESPMRIHLSATADASAPDS